MISSTSRCHKTLRFARQLTSDLLTCSCVALVFYFLALGLVYVHRDDSSRLADPSQQQASSCPSPIFIVTSNHSRPQSHLHAAQNMHDLVALVQHALVDSNLSYFVCYRTLRDSLLLPVGDSSSQLVHLAASNVLDLCVYDPNLNPMSMLHNVANQLGYSTLSLALDKVVAHSAARHIDRPSLVIHYDRLFGYYTLGYGSARLYLYEFVYAHSTRTEFGMARRLGAVYLQMNYVLKWLRNKALADDARQASTQLCLMDKLPLHMFAPSGDHEADIDIQDVARLPLPRDPREALMHLYPLNWWSYYAECR